MGCCRCTLTYEHVFAALAYKSGERVGVTTICSVGPLIIKATSYTNQSTSLSTRTAAGVSLQQPNASSSVRCTPSQQPPAERRIIELTPHSTLLSFWRFFRFLLFVSTVLYFPLVNTFDKLLKGLTLVAFSRKAEGCPCRVFHLGLRIGAAHSL